MTSVVGVMIALAIFVAYGIWLVARSTIELRRYLTSLTGRRVVLVGDQTEIKRLEGEIESVSDIDVIVRRSPDDRVYVPLSAIHWITVVAETPMPSWSRYGRKIEPLSGVVPDSTKSTRYRIIVVVYPIILFVSIGLSLLVPAPLAAVPLLLPVVAIFVIVWLERSRTRTR